MHPQNLYQNKKINFVHPIKQSVKAQLAYREVAKEAVPLWVITTPHVNQQLE